MKKIKKLQTGGNVDIVEFFKGKAENVETRTRAEYESAKNAYLQNKKIENNPFYDNWDNLSYARQYFEMNPTSKEVILGSTYDKEGNRWDNQIITAINNKSKKSKGLSPTGEIAAYDNNKPLTGSQVEKLDIMKKGGIIESDLGQWAFPGKVTKINSNKITMKGVNQPLIGISDSGDIQYMEPNKDYKFKGKSVTEYPIAQNGELLNNLGTSLLNNANNIVGGIGMLKQQKQQRLATKQGLKLSELTKQVSELDPELQPRKYVRPEDNILNPNELMPTYGTGSNFLAKNGKNVKKANWGDTLENLNEKNITNVAGSYLGGGTGQVSGESMLGKGIGSTIGSAFGPVGSLVGGALGSLAGGVIGAKGQKEQKENQRLINQNLTFAAFNQGNRNSPYMKNGGNTDLGGELQTLWGGEAEYLSENPYMPDKGETVMFKGNSHDTIEKGKSGIGVAFGKSKVEVEGGEPAVKTSNDNLTVFGNMKIPLYGVSELGDSKAKGKKFKNYISDLSEVENKQNKIIDDSLTILDDEDLSTPYDKLKFNSAKLMAKGADMKLKEIASKKQIASGIQNAILETAEEQNLDSDALAKGKIKKAKKTDKAQSGKNVYIGAEKIDPLEVISGGWEQFKNDPNLYHKENQSNSLNPPKGSEAFNKAFGEARKAGLKQFEFNGKMYGTELFKPENMVNNRKMAYVDNTLNPEIKLKPGDFNFSYKSNYVPPSKKQGDKPSESNLDWMDVLNSALPYFRPSNQSPLDPNQLSGEMFALSNNQIEPVQAQKYNPLLEQATDISLQDQLNANQSDFNAIQRLAANNPAALASLAAQKYSANSKVLADQFRINQQQKLSTYNKNREVLNDATLKNLAILDQQYTRQSQAKSNTKAVAQAALNSISDKIAKNKLENRTLGIYENLYNYRYLPNGQAINMNPLAKWNTQGDNLPIIGDDGQEYTIEETQEKDGKGMPTKYKLKKKTKVESSKNGSIVKSLKSY